MIFLYFSSQLLSSEAYLAAKADGTRLAQTPNKVASPNFNGPTLG
jgi:hypothetical protein